MIGTPCPGSDWDLPLNLRCLRAVGPDGPFVVVNDISDPSALFLPRCIADSLVKKCSFVTSSMIAFANGFDLCEYKCFVEMG